MTSVNHNHELRRLAPVVRTATAFSATPDHEELPGEGRTIQVDARFEQEGTWSGVNRLAELAYLDLLERGQHEVLDQHNYELHMVLPKYRDKITLKYACLTDTAIGVERTRNFPLDRAYRLVHGLVGLVLHWKRTSGDPVPWTVIVRSFDGAQHLATRFFAELARRGARQNDINVVIETRLDQSQLALRAPGMSTAPLPHWITNRDLEPVLDHRISEAEKEELERVTEHCSVTVFEENYPALLAYYRQNNHGLLAARIALKALCLCNHYGYYYESSSFADTVLPYFDQLAAGDEEARWNYVGNLFQGLVTAGSVDRASRVVEQLAAPCLTKPALRAKMSYLLSMIHLRYSKVPDLPLAEKYILEAIEYINAARDGLDPHDFFFLKVFIDNGVAFLRVRQGRHQEAMDLCQSGYELLSRELGDERHKLHRSVLQYNTAQVYGMLDRLDDALEHYRKSILMDPYYSEYYNESGNMLQRQGHYAEATAFYDLAIKYSAPYPEVHFNKAICHTHQEQWEEVLACFETSLELNPDQPEIYLLRADILDTRGQSEEALADYDMAIALKDGLVAARVNRAVLHFNRGSYELALSDIERVISLEPEQAAHYENRAQIYKAMNRESLYLRDLDTAERYRAAA